MNIIRYRTPVNRLAYLFDSAFSAEPTPAVEVFEDEQKFTVQVELPGLKKENFDITLHEDALTVSGKRSEEQTVSRSVNLSSPVKAGEVTASYEDGVLTVTLPKAEEAKPRKIQVS